MLTLPNRAILVLTFLLAVGFAATSALAQITIDGSQITFPDQTTQSTAGGGSGSGTESALTNIIPVPASGTDLQNGTALLAAAAGLTQMEVGEMAILQLEPGAYDLGSSTLTLSNDVSIRGTGHMSGTSYITSSGWATIALGDYCKLEWVRVYNSGATTKVVSANGTEQNEMTDVTLVHTGTRGVNTCLDVTGVLFFVNHCEFQAVQSNPSGTNVGISIRSAAHLIADSNRLFVWGGGTSNIGIGSNASDMDLVNAVVYVADTAAVGVRMTGGAGQLLMRDSFIVAYISTDFNGNIAYVKGSLLAATRRGLTNTALVHCYDDYFRPIEDTYTPVAARDDSTSRSEGLAGSGGLRIFRRPMPGGAPDRAK